MKFFLCILFAWLVPFFVTANQVKLFEENGKVGLKNDQGQVIIPAQYEALGWTDGNVSIVGKVTGYRLKNKWGLVSIDNHRITKAEYTELTPSENSLFVARKKTSLSLRLAAGCINAAGKVVIPFQYDGITISALRAIVFVRTENQFKYGLIDLTNNNLIPIKYRSIHPLGSLRFAVENFDMKISIFTDDGKQITDFLIELPHPTTFLTSLSISFISSDRCFFIATLNLPRWIALSSCCGRFVSKYCFAFVCACSLSCESLMCISFVSSNLGK